MLEVFCFFFWCVWVLFVKICLHRCRSQGKKHWLFNRLCRQLSDRKKVKSGKAMYYFRSASVPKISWCCSTEKTESCIFLQNNFFPPNLLIQCCSKQLGTVQMTFLYHFFTILHFQSTPKHMVSFQYQCIKLKTLLCSDESRILRIMICCT